MFLHRGLLLSKLIMYIYLNKNYNAEEKAALKNPKYFYEVEFDKPGSLMMPIIAELQFEDGTSETHKFPVQIWRRNNTTAKRVFATEKKVVKIQCDYIDKLNPKTLFMNDNGINISQAFESKVICNKPASYSDIASRLIIFAK